jgi:hypothetical protein
MKVLVACEYSGRVRDAFIAAGHEAMSCDLLPSEATGQHYQGDVLELLDRGWDLMIAHPPCTYLTVSAEWAYRDVQTKKMKPSTLIGQARRDAREEAIRFVMALANAPIPRIAIENPVGVLSTRWREPDQFIQPYEYGDDASKKTCLWLKGLPLLQPTSLVDPRLVNGKPRWGNQTGSGQNKLPPSADRWKLRSATYAGIAAAMADQWGRLL